MDIFRLEFALQFWRQMYHQELEMKEIHGGDSWQHYRAAIRQAGAQRVQEKELARKLAETLPSAVLKSALGILTSPFFSKVGWASARERLSDRATTAPLNRRITDFMSGIVALDALLGNL